MKTLRKMISILLVAAMALSLMGASNASRTYDKAQDKLAEGKYEKAAELFDSIASYEDSAILAMYCKALVMGEKGDYENAVKALTMLGDLKDCPYFIVYYTAAAYAKQGEEYPYALLDAAETYDSIPLFRDSMQKAEGCRRKLYDLALSLMSGSEADLLMAAVYFDELGDYLDSNAKVAACVETIYAAALALKEDGKYEEAIALFETLSGYKDSAEQTDVIFGGADGAYISYDSTNFAAPLPTPTPEPTENVWPDIDITMDIYSVINENNLLPSVYEIPVDTIATTTWMQFRTDHIDELNAMIYAMIDAGFKPYIAGAYQTYSYQSRLFNQKASQIAYEKTGGKMVDYTDPIYQEAAKEAEKIVMKPGSSEHQLGLAVDLLDRERSRMVYADMDQDFFAWLDEHCWEYGFIKRYPTKKLLLTGWDEPWHYRYVGQEAAKFIMENDLCLEEFYAHYDPSFKYR